MTLVCAAIDSRVMFARYAGKQVASLVWTQTHHSREGAFPATKRQFIAAWLIDNVSGQQTVGRYYSVGFAFY